MSKKINFLKNKNWFLILTLIFILSFFTWKIYWGETSWRSVGGNIVAADDDDDDEGSGDSGSGDSSGGGVDGDSRGGCYNSMTNCEPFVCRGDWCQNTDGSWGLGTKNCRSCDNCESNTCAGSQCWNGCNWVSGTKNCAPTCSYAGPDGWTTTGTGGSQAVYAYGVNNANAVNFATWTTVNGQDDLIWYSGGNQGGGTWRANINLASHPGNGEIAVHVYLEPYGRWCDTAGGSRICSSNNCANSTCAGQTCWDGCQTVWGARNCNFDNGCAANTCVGQTCWNSYQWVNGAKVCNQAPSAINLSVVQPDYRVAGPAATFSWTFSDPDAGDTQASYQVQVATNSGFSGPGTVINSNQVSSGSGSYATGSGKLSYDKIYYWRVKVWDNYGNASAWADGDSFTTPKHQDPTADFSWAPISPSAREEVQFTDLSQVFGGATKQSWLWSIPDAEYVGGTNAASQHPQVKFTSAGDKTVTLTIADSDGFSNAKTAVITVRLPLPGWKEVAPQ